MSTPGKKEPSQGREKATWESAASETVAALPEPVEKLKGFTSSGSMSLNSIPLPVQAMKWELVGLSNKVTRNCQSWRDPLLWYGGPSRYPPASCLMSPAENKQGVSKGNSAKTLAKKSTFHRCLPGIFQFA